MNDLLHVAIGLGLLGCAVAFHLIFKGMNAILRVLQVHDDVLNKIVDDHIEEFSDERMGGGM